MLLSDQDRHTSTGYYQQNPLQSQPLPPGIAKNLARGKPLPPGIAKRGLPNTLTSRLSIPSGYELLSVGTDVLLVAIGTRIIADVLRDVVTISHLIALARSLCCGATFEVTRTST